MCYAEIRDQLQTLTKEERKQLALDLKALALLDDPEYMAELDQIIDETEQGARPAYSAAQLREILAARGVAAA